MSSARNIAHQGVSAQSRETTDYLLAHYVAGTLPAPLRALVGAHLELKPSGLRAVNGLEALAGQALEGIEPSPLSARDAMLEAIMARQSPPRAAAAPGATRSRDILPASLVDFAGFTANDIPWRSRLPGFREARLPDADGLSASFLWIRPGRAMPHHTHEGSELTLVVAGGFADGIGHYQRGDIAAADEGVDHRPVADEGEPCICFAVTSGALKVTGSWAQLFSDIFGR